jgi:uncharacterized membrane protein
MESSKEEGGLQFERIVFFSDAVFAIAITLLVIEIKAPHIESAVSERESLISVAKLIPNFIGYVISFMVIGAYWVGHHRIYGMISRWDYGLIWRNVAFLLTIAFIPFTTAFFSENATRVVPMVFYAFVFALAGSMQVLQWRYAVGKGLTEPGLDPAYLNQVSNNISLLPAAGIVAALIGLVHPMFAGFAFMLIPFGRRIIRNRYEKSTRSEEPRDELAA